MDQVQTPDELYTEIVKSYADFREKVHEYDKSTTRCKAAIKNYQAAVEYVKPENDEESKILSIRVTLSLYDLHNFCVLYFCSFPVL